MALFESNILYFYYFSDNSKLKEFLINEGYCDFKNIVEFTLPFVLEPLVKTITTKKLYFQNNPCIIITNQILGEALSQRVFFYQLLAPLVERLLKLSQKDPIDFPSRILPSWFQED